MVATPALAFQFDSIHSDPIAPVILGVTGILFIALIGRFGARKIGLPSVLGELMIGILVGNLAYFFHIDLFMVLREGPAIFVTVENMLQGDSLELACMKALGADGVDTPAVQTVLELLRGPNGVELLQIAQTVDVFSRYGIIFLLFLVGLDTSLGEMRKAGTEAARVAVIGVFFPFVLGFLSSHFLLPEMPVTTSLFLGATLAATSVGITAMVLQEMNMQSTDTSRIIIGAAVFDDVLGLMLLAIVSGIVVTGTIDLFHIALIIFSSMMFILFAFYLGPLLIAYIIKMMHHFDEIEAKMFVSYMFVMVLAWVANLAGLATIIGAFAAGLILQDTYFRDWNKGRKCPKRLKDLIMPLEVILVPIFFVLMGIQVKLEIFFDLDVVILAAGLLVSAILGKVFCGFGAAKGRDKWTIGAGMLPRGEVGLVFAAIGQNLGVIDDALFSAIVLMVILTTLIAPPWLKFCLKRSTRSN